MSDRTERTTRSSSSPTVDETCNDAVRCIVSYGNRAHVRLSHLLFVLISFFFLVVSFLRNSIRQLPFISVPVAVWVASTAPHQSIGVSKECFNNIGSNEMAKCGWKCVCCIVSYACECEMQNAMQHFLLASDSHSIASAYAKRTWTGTHTINSFDSFHLKWGERRERETYRHNAVCGCVWKNDVERVCFYSFVIS